MGLRWGGDWSGDELVVRLDDRVQELPNAVCCQHLRDDREGDILIVVHLATRVGQ